MVKIKFFIINVPIILPLTITNGKAFKF